MLTYRYRPLEHDDSFRILVIFPSLDNSDPIRCTIAHAQLSDESFEYEAVSYTWGDAAATQTIYFPSAELNVGRNCYNVLRRLRCKHQDCLLWIDAVCIDQNNLQERACQVRMMEKIYNRASTVLVILQEPNANSDALFEQLKIGDEMISLVGRWVRDPPSDHVLKLLEDLWRDPWFTRVWVLQEVFAKTTVYFISGSTCFSYDSLAQLYTCYGGTITTKAYCPRAIQWIRLPPGNFSTPQFNLWYLLSETRDYLATDAKDRVFALKSMLGSAQSEMDYLIDYTHSLEECYACVATFLLPVLGLRLLTAARHTHDKKMPSWIPDWSQNLPIHPTYPEDEDKLGTSDDRHSFAREEIDAFSNSLQQCRIGLMDNGELVIVPEAIRCGDVIVIISGAIVACALRFSSEDGSWALISGDCHMSTENFRSPRDGSHFMCDEYVACHQDRLEEFRLR
ncbi:HET-domain-containing protein [Alternaria alternata]|nr:HET-domain-containing protein [Alternaria alternata]